MVGTHFLQTRYLLLNRNAPIKIYIETTTFLISKVYYENKKIFFKIHLNFHRWCKYVFCI